MDLRAYGMFVVDGSLDGKLSVGKFDQAEARLIMFDIQGCSGLRWRAPANQRLSSAALHFAKIRGPLVLIR